MVYGVGAGISPACLFAMPSRVAGQGPAAATAFGVIIAGRNMGVLFGPVLLAEVLRAGGGCAAAAPVFAAVTAGALAVGLMLAVRFPGENRAV